MPGDAGGAPAGGEAAGGDEPDGDAGGGEAAGRAAVSAADVLAGTRELLSPATREESAFGTGGEAAAPFPPFRFFFGLGRVSVSFCARRAESLEIVSAWGSR